MSEMQRVGEWQPGRFTVLLWAAFNVVLFGLGLGLFLGLWTSRWGDAEIEVSGVEMLVGMVVLLALTALLLALHELIHGAVIKAYGGSPQFGFTMVGKVMPAISCISPGARFSRWQFILIALAPGVVLTLMTVLVIWITPHGGWLVLPGALHLGGCVGDIALAWKALEQPSGTLIEDQQSGLRFYRRAT